MAAGTVDASQTHVTVTNLRRLLKFNQELYFDFSFSMSTMIDYLSDHIEDDGSLASIRRSIDGHISVHP